MFNFIDMKIFRTLLTLTALVALASCTGIESVTSPEPPKIVLEGDEPIYRVKVGEPLTLSPIVQNAGDDAAYRWTIEGKVVGTEPQYTYVGDEAGQVYIMFEVVNDAGQDQAEMMVEVMPLNAPVITLAVPEDGYSVLLGTDLVLEPLVDNAEGASFLWTIDGQEVAETQNYTFSGDTPGEYAFRFSVTNEDGEDSVEFSVVVKTEAEMDFIWSFEQHEYNVTVGRTVYIRPYYIEGAFDATYSWTVDGEAVEPSDVDLTYTGIEPAALLAFTPEAERTYDICLTMTNSYGTSRASFTVNGCPQEGTYRRATSADSSADCNRVYEFLAAPGQFVNERYTALTSEEACTYAEERFASDAFISLGAFGGYVVVGFDHSIENDGGYNIRIEGNSLTNSSEPGIVWVMQDENGNGLPDDTWYELKGSEYGAEGSRLDYAVTYYRPSAPGQPVAWTDNEGGSGEIDYLSSFHRQDYYYPLWVSEDSYTIVGRRLRSRTVQNGSVWENQDYDWGYADNFSTSDRLTGDGNTGGGVNANHFKIDNAVTFDGRPANLAYIDFVKIQTGVQAKAPSIGEVSTEVYGVSDYNLIKNN